MNPRTLLLAAAFLAAPAAAQQPPPGASPAKVPAAISPEAAGAEEPAAAPDPAKAKRAAEQIARIRDAVKQATARAEAARAAKDVVKLNCVNEKLAQMRSFLKGAERSEAALAGATARAADEELEKIRFARARAEALRGECDRCQANLAYAVDDRTRIEVQAPPGLPEPADRAAERERTAPAAPPVVRPRPSSVFQ